LTVLSPGGNVLALMEKGFRLAAHRWHHEVNR
jgi:hypothetical protein